MTQELLIFQPALGPLVAQASTRLPRLPEQRYYPLTIIHSVIIIRMIICVGPAGCAAQSVWDRARVRLHTPAEATQEDRGIEQGRAEQRWVPNSPPRRGRRDERERGGGVEEGVQWRGELGGEGTVEREARFGRLILCSSR